jgi:hypothetical protein
VVRTSLPKEAFSAEQTVAAYKDLSQVEWAFRSIKSVELKVRPSYHWKDDRMRAPVFLCLLAYYLERHLRADLAELLFDDHEREAAEQTRKSIVSPQVAARNTPSKALVPPGPGRGASGDGLIPAAVRRIIQCGENPNSHSPKVREIRALGSRQNCRRLAWPPILCRPKI